MKHKTKSPVNLQGGMIVYVVPDQNFANKAKAQIVSLFRENEYEVLLLENCKEFTKGTQILVSSDELLIDNE